MQTLNQTTHTHLDELLFVKQDRQIGQLLAPGWRAEAGIKFQKDQDIPARESNHRTAIGYTIRLVRAAKRTQEVVTTARTQDAR